MIHANISEKRAVPLWAAIGAPLLGVPIMVALLSLTAPVEGAPAGAAPVGELEVGVRTEQVEVQTVQQAIDLDADCFEPPRSG